jgi:DNA-binding CsgD family transcriptional regulator/PAS domain-containing protein
MRNENHNYDPVALSQYNSYWCTKDIRIAAGSNLPVGEAMFTDNVLPRRAWVNSEVFNDFLVPTDVPWILAFWLHKARDKIVAVSIQGSRHRGPYCEQDGARIKPLLPHLRRALEIKDRLEVAQIRCDTLTTSLDTLSFGVLILDVDGHIIETSAAAAELMRDDHGIRRNSDGTVWLREPAGLELKQWIFKGSPTATHNKDGLLHVPRPHAQPLSVMVTRLPEMSASWFRGGPPRWKLLLFDPDRRLLASTALIASDLGVSAREAEIAALVVAGYEVKTIALRLNISIHTVRTHLKAVFSSTGLRSQADLVRRITSGPASMRFLN